MATKSGVYPRICIKIEKGNVIEIEDLITRLAGIRYLRVPEIDGKGQFSVRGDIVDIFSVFIRKSC